MFKMIFFTHDLILEFLVRYKRHIYLTLLIADHLILLGLFFPEYAKVFGNLAINLLIIILFLIPIALLTKSKILIFLLHFRRPLGIAMGYSALVHGFGFIFSPQWFKYVFIDNWPASFLNPPFLLLGGLALIFVIPPLLTSNKVAMIFLGRKWKKVQCLVYLVFIAAVIHQQLAETYLLSQALLRSLPIILIYFYLRLSVNHPQYVPGLPRLINLINQKYLIYQLGKKPAAD